MTDGYGIVDSIEKDDGIVSRAYCREKHLRSTKTMTSSRCKACLPLVQRDRTVFINRVNLIQTEYASRFSQRMSSIWHNQDLWSVIMSFLDSKALLRLALTNRDFHKMAMEESVWKLRCFKDLDIPDTVKPLFSWRSLYAAAVDGSHSYSRREWKAHIDWMRVGAFSIECGEAIASNRLCNFNDAAHDEQKGGLTSLFSISNIKNGPWIAGTMQTLEARHWELYLDSRYTAGNWQFEEVATYTVPYHTPRAAAGIFDKERFQSKETSDLLNLNSWNFAPGDWQPRGKTSKYAVASSTQLQQNDGLQVRFSVLRAGLDGLVVGLRVTQQLI